MHAESTRPSAKRDVQKLRSAKCDDRITRPRRAQTCERSELRAKRAMRMCPLYRLLQKVSPCAKIKHATFRNIISTVI